MKPTQSNHCIQHPLGTVAAARPPSLPYAYPSWPVLPTPHPPTTTTHHHHRPRPRSRRRARCTAPSHSAARSSTSWWTRCRRWTACTTTPWPTLCASWPKASQGCTWLPGLAGRRSMPSPDLPPRELSPSLTPAGLAAEQVSTPLCHASPHQLSPGIPITTPPYIRRHGSGAGRPRRERCAGGQEAWPGGGGARARAPAHRLHLAAARQLRGAGAQGGAAVGDAQRSGRCRKAHWCLMSVHACGGNLPTPCLPLAALTRAPLLLPSAGPV